MSKSFFSNQCWSSNGLKNSTKKCSKHASNSQKQHFCKNAFKILSKRHYKDLFLRSTLMKSCWKNLWNVTLHCADSRMPDSYFTQSLGKMHIFQTSSCTIRLMRRSHFCLKTSRLLHLDLSASIKCHFKKEGNVHIELKSKTSFSNLEKMHISQASNRSQYSYIISNIQFSLKTSQLLNLDL